MIHSVPEAEDIVQELMLRMWDKKAEWLHINNVEAYCMTMVRHLTLDRLRAAESRTEPLSAETDKPDPSFLPSDQLEQQETTTTIWKIISMLPEKQQQIIQLREFEELSYQKIAEQMEISEEQVKINLFRARKKIKEIYEKLERYGLL